MNALDDRKERINKFLKWIQNQKGCSIWEIKDWFFSNYALSEKAINDTLKQLKDYGYLIVRGTNFYIGKKKQLL